MEAQMVITYTQVRATDYLSPEHYQMSICGLLANFVKHSKSKI